MTTSHLSSEDELPLSMRNSLAWWREHLKSGVHSRRSWDNFFDELTHDINKLVATREAEARIDENKYYAKLLKLNEKNAYNENRVKVDLRKVFEYRLKQLTTTNPSKDKK